MKLLIGIITMTLLASSFTFTPRAKAQAGRTRNQTSPPNQPSPPPPPPSTAQEVDDDEVINIDTKLVTLTATVTDKQGRNVANLKRSDFVIYEDGVRQEPTYFNTGDRVPVSLGIVFDTSGSMVDKIDGVKDVVEHFVKSVAPGDEIFFVRFSDDAEIVQDFTDNRRRILRAVENLDRFSIHFMEYPQNLNHSRASDSVIVARASLIAWTSAS